MYKTYVLLNSMILYFVTLQPISGFFFWLYLKIYTGLLVFEVSKGVCIYMC